MTAPERLYHLALRDVHAAAGAKFISRSGWSLPASYGDWVGEHRAIRESAAVMDRSQRSRVMVTGTDAAELLGRVFAGHVNELEEGRAMRAVALAAAGHISDLVLIARTGGIAYLVTGEPGRREATVASLRAAAPADWDVRVDDRTEVTCGITLAGPGAEAAVREHLADPLPARLQTLHTATFELHGFRALAARASDTGEDGFEFVLAPAVAQHVLDTLTDAGVTLAGFDAQEAARIEACVPAYDPDLEPGLSPAGADLDVLLGIPGGDSRVILSAVLFEGDAAPPVGATVTAARVAAGQLRSSTWSPTLRAAIGLAILDSRVALPGTALDAAGIPGTIVAKPFYRRRH